MNLSIIPHDGDESCSFVILEEWLFSGSTLSNITTKTAIDTRMTLEALLSIPTSIFSGTMRVSCQLMDIHSVPKEVPHPIFRDIRISDQIVIFLDIVLIF